MHHKLIDRGFSQRHLVWALYGVAAVCGAAGFAIALGGRHVVLGGLAVLLFVFLVGFMTLGYVEFREIKRIGRRILEQRQVVANDVIIRKISQLIKKNSCLGELAEELRTAFFEAGFDGFELVLPDAMKLKFPCDLRSYATSWGCTDQHSASFWTMSVDLKGCSGRKLGCIRLSRKTEGGSLLFDANLLMSELQPALVSALERCISRDCSRRNSDAAVCQAPLKQIRRPAVVEYAPSSTLDDSQKVAQNLDDVGRSEKSN